MSFEHRFGGADPPIPDIPPQCEECPEDKFNKCKFAKSELGEPCQEVQTLFDDMAEHERLRVDENPDYDKGKE